MKLVLTAYDKIALYKCVDSDTDVGYLKVGTAPSG